VFDLWRGWGDRWARPTMTAMPCRSHSLRSRAISPGAGAGTEEDRPALRHRISRSAWSKPGAANCASPTSVGARAFPPLPPLTGNCSRHKASPGTTPWASTMPPALSRIPIGGRSYVDPFLAWTVVSPSTKMSMPRKPGGHTLETEMRPTGKA
jgi:hypothetical protein